MGSNVSGNVPRNQPPKSTIPLPLGYKPRRRRARKDDRRAAIDTSFTEDPIEEDDELTDP